ncbi:bifunctional Heat shock protein 70 family/ATPase [Babesia duncani]|uniref:Bifunctional Heat shock protein 70 family/ATPase n=1 Tax=Babesia duncani TaxID=323732 RepID=A0AAD9PNC2_9APIC|nr:bifunctional Heat shock protein 70 family/ATPase [Babesia duncani]
MPVLGIDIGGSTSTVATISKGAIDIVLNDVAQRYTPSCVSFTAKQRLFGDQAHTQIVSNYRNTCRNFASLVGRSLEDDSEYGLTEIEKFFACTQLESAEDGYVGFKIQHGNLVESTSSVLTGFLGYLVGMADRFTGRNNREAVVAYPGWFSETQKQCLRACVTASGLSCLRVISHVHAMAMDYGVYRVKQLNDETPTRVALVMIGHCHASAAIVDFYASHCSILSQVSRRNLGGRNLDMMLMKYMATEFSKKYHCDPLENNKTRLKVEAVAVKTRRVLSANAESSYSAECLMEDNDMSGHITRTQFEEMCNAEFIPQLIEMLKECIEASRTDLDSIFSVEIAGGSSRIPCIQQAISSIFNKVPSRTLNADECIARGCVLEAAIKSNHYRVREYKTRLTLPRSLTLGYFNGQEPMLLEAIAAGTPLGDPIRVTLQAQAPVCVRVALGDALDPRSQDALGTLDIARHISQEAQPAPVTTNDGAAIQTDEQDAEIQSESSPSGGISVTLGFDDCGQFVASPECCEYRWLPATILDIARLEAAELEARGRDLKENSRLQALNDFETLLYTVRDKMQSSHRDFIDPQMIPAYESELDHWREWLYENSGASQETLQEGIDKVSSEWKRIDKYFKEHQNKLENLEPFLQRLQERYNFCCEDNNPNWHGATPEERLNFAQELMDLDSRVRQMHQDESQRPRHMEPLFTMQQIQGEMQKLLVSISEFCQAKAAKAPAQEPPEQQPKEQQE